MRFATSRQELMQLLLKMQTVIGQKSSLPILSNILVETKGNEVIFTATDLTVGVKGILAAKVMEQGSTTLPARRLVQLVKELTIPQIEICTDSDNVTDIVANTSRFKLHGMSSEEFPSLPDLSEADKCTMDQATLRECLYRTAFTVSREDMRYVLTGVLMDLRDDVATFVGTDGKRLAKAHGRVEGHRGQGSYILPIKAVEELLKSLEDSGEATLYLMKDKVGIDTTSVFIITKLLEGEFPDYMRVIPASVETVLTLHREEMTSLLKQVSLFTTDTNQSVKFSFSKGELQLSANAMDIGEGKVSMPVNYNGDKLDIAFNPAYFLDILRHCQEETISLGVTDPFNPGVLIDKEDAEGKGSSKEDLFVLMPMRLDEQ